MKLAGIKSTTFGVLVSTAMLVSCSSGGESVASPDDFDVEMIMSLTDCDRLFAIGAEASAVLDIELAQEGGIGDVHEIRAGQAQMARDAAAQQLIDLNCATSEPATATTAARSPDSSPYTGPCSQLDGKWNCEWPSADGGTSHWSCAPSGPGWACEGDYPDGRMLKWQCNPSGVGGWECGWNKQLLGITTCSPAAADQWACVLAVPDDVTSVQHYQCRPPDECVWMHNGEPLKTLDSLQLAWPVPLLVGPSVPGTEDPTPFPPLDDTTTTVVAVDCPTESMMHNAVANSGGVWRPQGIELGVPVCYRLYALVTWTTPIGDWGRVAFYRDADGTWKFRANSLRDDEICEWAEIPRSLWDGLGCLSVPTIVPQDCPTQAAMGSAIREGGPLWDGLYSLGEPTCINERAYVSFTFTWSGSTNTTEGWASFKRDGAGRWVMAGYSDVPSSDPCHIVWDEDRAALGCPTS